MSGDAIINDVLTFRVAVEYQRRDSEAYYRDYAGFDLFYRLIEVEHTRFEPIYPSFQCLVCALI